MSKLSRKNRQLRAARKKNQKISLHRLEESQRNRLETQIRQLAAAQRLAALNVPAPPVSEVRLVEERASENSLAGGLSVSRLRVTQFIPCRAEEQDRERVIDQRLIQMLQRGIVSPEAVRELRYCVQLQDFQTLPVRHWNGQREELRFLGDSQLWDRAGNSTELGEELWRLFRLRIRREGALEKIIQAARRERSHAAA